MALALGLYLRTMAPGLLGGDSGEFQFAAWNLGLAHATGYPLYLMLGWLWQHLLAPFGLSPATSLNAMSALYGTLSVGMLYIVVRGWVEGPLNLRRAIAAFCSLLLTVSPTFWSQSLIAEVYTLHTLLLLLLFWIIQHLYKTKYILLLALIIGLSLTHHAMTLLMLPCLFIVIYYLLPREKPIVWGLALLIMILPLGLYLYIPLRSNLESSPWYHQQIGEQTLTLYENNWPSFINFVTGRSISVGFHSLGEAWGNLAEAGLLWRIHFQWIGLFLAILGLTNLIKQRNWPLLILTLLYALCQQIFNLFYAIDDILVYYIPLYLMGIIWAGFGLHHVAALAWQLGDRTSDIDENHEDHIEVHEIQSNDGSKHSDPGQMLGIFVVLAACLLPLSIFRTYLPSLDQHESTTAREMWEAILAAQPADDAILISNDRNEIVPLFYLQYVENRGQDMAGLFPLLKPDAAFADVGTVTQWALENSNGRPVYLVKEMAGLEVKFDLVVKEPEAPLVHVMEEMAATLPPAYLHEKSFGPLNLLGYDRHISEDSIEIILQWQVVDRIENRYTTTVQLFDMSGEKVGQSDHPAGGLYYPTSLWKVGEKVVERHLIQLSENASPKKLFVAMYNPEGLSHLAPPLEIELSAD